MHNRNLYRQTKEKSQTIRVLEYKFLSPTHHRGARVKIIDRWFKKSVTISFDHTYNTAYETAISWLLECGWDVQGVNSECKVIIIGTWDSRDQLDNKGKK